jgi:putative N-acetyltransferase (TIGR04045 family)
VSAAASPSLSAPSACRLAAVGDELARHYAVRHAVFVIEQALFGPDDRDARDEDGGTLHVVGLVDGQVTGTVRLYPLDGDGLWKGDRLAVLPAHRHGLLGAELVRFAVRTAGAGGGVRMVAMIQLANVRFFSALGWQPAGPVAPYHGVAHQPMEIALSRPGR